MFVADGIFFVCNSEKNVSIAWYNRIIIDYSFCLHLVCTHKSEKVKKAFGSSDDKLKATKKQHSIGYFQLQICSNWVRFSIPFMLNWFSFCFTICDANIIKFDKWFTTILYIYFIPKVVLIINSSQNKNNSSFFAFQLLINLIPFPDKASDRLQSNSICLFFFFSSHHKCFSSVNGSIYQFVNESIIYALIQWKEIYFWLTNRCAIFMKTVALFLLISK